MAGYLIYRFSTWFLSRLPFRMLYILSDVLSFVLFRVVRYRRRLVFKQLRACFPSWSEEKIWTVARDSYTNLSDVLLENFKTEELTPEQMRKHYRMINPEVPVEVAKKAHGVLGISSHFNNWEWSSIELPRSVQMKIYALYKPLANKRINRHIKKVREDAGTKMISIGLTRRLFVEPAQEDSMYVFVADQSPSNMRKAIWVDFLGRDTACLHGPQLYHDLTGYPAVYYHVYRIKRGYYEVKFTEIEFGNGKSLTQEFMKLLEKDILENPSSWLWTHNRWKRRREEAEEQRLKVEAKRKARRERLRK